MQATIGMESIHDMLTEKTFFVFQHGRNNVALRVHFNTLILLLDVGPLTFH